MKADSALKRHVVNTIPAIAAGALVLMLAGCGRIDMSSPEGTTTQYVREKGVLVYAPRSARAQKVVFDTPEKEMIHAPGPDFVDRVVALTDRPPRVLGALQRLHGHGRLGGTGYLSILPVDQGIEHTAGASFAPNPIYFDPEILVKLAIEDRRASHRIQSRSRRHSPAHLRFGR